MQLNATTAVRQSASGRFPGVVNRPARSLSYLRRPGSTAGSGPEASRFSLRIRQAGLIIFLAYFISHTAAGDQRQAHVRPALLALGVLVAMVAGPDLGTANVLVVTAAVLFYVAGSSAVYVSLRPE